MRFLISTDGIAINMDNIDRIDVNNDIVLINGLPFIRSTNPKSIFTQIVSILIDIDGENSDLAMENGFVTINNNGEIERGII